MQSVTSRIWTRVAVSISYDDNHYTTGTSIESLILSLMNMIWINYRVHKRLVNTDSDALFVNDNWENQNKKDIW